MSFEDDKFKNFQRPDFGTHGQIRPPFSRGVPASKRPGTSNNIDLFEVMTEMAQQHFSEPRGDDGVSGKRICLVAHYETISKDDVRDPAIVEVLEMQALSAGETLTQVLVVYGPVAGGSSSMLTTPVDPTTLPDSDPAKALDKDYTRIVRYPRFYALPSSMDPSAPILGHEGFVEFIEKQTQSWGIFLGMVSQDPGMMHSPGGSSNTISPKDAHDSSSAPRKKSPVTDITGIDDTLTPPLPPAGKKSYVKLMKELAGKLGLPVSVAFAFFKTESGGIGMCQRDRPDKGKSPITTRFEPHVFARLLMKKGGSAFQKFKTDPKGWWVPLRPDYMYWGMKRGKRVEKYRRGKHSAALIKKWRSKGYGHGNVCTDTDMAMMSFAAERWCESCAFECASFGLPQILGLHYKKMGFSSAKAMYLGFSNSEELQIRAFFNFIEINAKGKILKNLKKGHSGFPEAIRIYNGCNLKGGGCDGYVSKMKKFSARYAKNMPKDRTLLVNPAIAPSKTMVA